MKYYLGLDVGGTNFAAGIVNDDMKVVAKEVVPAGASRSIEEITDDMFKVSEKAANSMGLTMSDFTSWGIGMPSYVNPKTGLLVHANCFTWKNVPIFDYLENKTNIPIYIENDANCAALGETLAGGARGSRNVVMLTLGTGLGGGIILDGKIYAGADLMGAELGHTKLVAGGVQCTCGQYGCAESYCSATGLIREAKEMLSDYPDSLITDLCNNNYDLIDGRMIFDAYEKNDTAAKLIIENYVEYLSCAMSTFVTIFRPETIIIGGGVANAKEKLLNPLNEALYRNTFAAQQIGVPPVKCAELGNDAGIIGAAMLEKYGIDRRRGNRNEQSQ